jgi:ABC-type transport system involved in multi-copper enzyme maturation permease subunit
MGGVTEGKGVGQLAAIAIGLAYAVGGVIGFAVTGFSGVTAPVGNKLLFLSLNPFQDFIHLGIGALLLLAGLKWSAAQTEGVLLGVGGIYVVAAIAGFTYAHIPVITIVTAGNADNYLHAITGATAILAALMSASLTNQKARSRTALGTLQ